MKIDADFKPLPTSADHNCFACSPANAAGLQMTFFASDDAVYSRIAIPEHLCGWNGVAHGGVVSTILDETMSWAAMVLLKRLGFTQKMTVEFFKTVAVGALMVAESRVLAVRDSREAVIEGVLTDGDVRVDDGEAEEVHIILYLFSRALQLSRQPDSARRCQSA